MTPGVQVADRLEDRGAHAASLAAASLLRRQHREGYWWGDLTADTTLESDYILLQLWLHPPANGEWRPPTRHLIDKAVRAILARQLRDGGFNLYPCGTADVSASVKAYFALKVAGLDPTSPELSKARRRILELGGVQAANSYVKLNLSLFDLYPREFTPSVPPELMLLGNLVYEMSSWTRAIVIPLSVVHSANPRKPVPAGFDIKELFHPECPLEFAGGEGLLSWHNFFLQADKLLKLWERFGPRRIRLAALQRAEKWILDHTKHSDGLGAIYPAMQYAVMALDVLGHAPGHPDRDEAQRQFDALLVDDGERFFFQPCFSPVWDTAIAAFALGESGLASEKSLARCGAWLLSKEVRRKGDWAVKRPDVEPSGWYFEFANEFYPDIDDTAMVLLALDHTHGCDEAARRAAIDRAVKWLLAMQSSNGGWAAFDMDNNWNFLSAVPFADHNAMLDPACPDITGRVIEALVRQGIKPAHPAIRKGVQFLRRTQELDGSWFGRWGVNYVYGTFLAMRGLRAAGEDPRDAHLLRAAEWLRSVQNADGGWGESCESYERNTFVAAPSTPTQTAWAVLGLLAAGDNRSSSARKGVEYLIETQGPDGCWREHLATGTGFPKVFYLTYHMYRDMFPLLALSTFTKSQAADRGELK